VKAAALGLDTSNYRTSVALVDEDGRILMNHRELLPVPEGARGLRQSEAVFAQVRQLRESESLLRQAAGEARIAVVAASTRPGDGEASYMPVFQVGHTVGAMLAAAMNVPLVMTTHQRGHLAAAGYGTRLQEAESYLALHLSGGTTDLLSLRGDTLETLGSGGDLHAGQLVDRIGVAMGLPFPAGEALEQLAARGRSEGRLGKSVEREPIVCHFSGAETRAMGWIREGCMPREDIAREVYDLLSRTVIAMLRAGMEKTGQREALIAGGVASSTLLREMLTHRCQRECPALRLTFGRPELSGDNAVGVALIGVRSLKSGGRSEEYGGANP